MTLFYYSYKTANTKGKEHATWLNLLRKYIREQDMTKLLQEFEEISDDKMLRAIQEAGARGELWHKLQEKIGGVK